MLPLFIRNQLTDRSLAPLRKQISSLLPENCTVLEVGCANGTLLLENTHRITKGYGMDVDEKMIRYAQKKADKLGVDNLTFLTADVRRWQDFIADDFTHVIASLCLHEMGRETAIAALRDFQTLGCKFIIADLFEPESKIKKWFLHFDERMAGHLNRYKDYRDHGGMDSLIKEVELTVEAQYSTRIPAVRIWVCV